MKDIEEQPHQFVKVAVLDSVIEAQLVDSLLKDMDIPHRLRSFHDTAYNGLFQVQKGWGELYAPSEYLEDISQLIHHVRSSSQNAGA